MSLKRFLLALTAVAMLAAVTAGSASATAVTEPSEAYVEGTGNPQETLHGSEAVQCSIGEHNGEKKLVLEGEVGSIAPRIKTKLTATGVKCVEAKIFNDEEAGKQAATDTGRLVFTGVTVSEPPNCKVVGETVETELLETELYMDVANPAITFDRFAPDAAAGATRFAVVPIEEGGTCTIGGHKVVKGIQFGQAVNLTGVPAVNQPLTFSKEIDETAGSELTFAGNPARLTGKVNNELVSGKEFSAKHP